MTSPDSHKPGFLLTDKLVKRFDDVLAVADVSISIQKGEIFALLGSSGCGKSTLLRMLAGFETPTSGRVLLDGVDIAALPPYERPINMMFQSYALFPHLNVWDNVAFGLKREGMPVAQINSRVEEMLNLVQLAAYAKRRDLRLRLLRYPTNSAGRPDFVNAQQQEPNFRIGAGKPFLQSTFERKYASASCVSDDELGGVALSSIVEDRLGNVLARDICKLRAG